MTLTNEQRLQVLTALMAARIGLRTNRLNLDAMPNGLAAQDAEVARAYLRRIEYEASQFPLDPEEILQAITDPPQPEPA